jgi:hypothetical protein
MIHLSCSDRSETQHLFHQSFLVKIVLQKDLNLLLIDISSYHNAAQIRFRLSPEFWQYLIWRYVETLHYLYRETFQTMLRARHFYKHAIHTSLLSLTTTT